MFGRIGKGEAMGAIPFYAESEGTTTAECLS